MKKVLEALDGVEQAEVSHETGTAVVEMTEEVADEVLKKAVEDQDYKVLVSCIMGSEKCRKLLWNGSSARI